MLPEQIVLFSLIITVFGSFFYIRDIVRGKTKPNLVSWFFWSLAPIIGSFLQFKAGAGWSILPVFLAGFVPLVIFFIALLTKNSHWHITKFDIWCGIFSFLSLILWVLTRRTDISILFAILSDGLAAIPTLIKSWKFPETETAIGYSPGIFNNILGLLVIKNWNFSIYSFGIYFILLNSIIILFIKKRELLQFFLKFFRNDTVN
jgi:hypothetical protein